jgi:NAD(P)-dependent dehydrogenase (short-subunit alcohol dehydrogenase family)
MGDRTCLITGASRGIGLATALRCSAQGYNVVAVARDPDRLREAARRIESCGRACEPILADLADWKQAGALIDAALARFGRLDVLVNNAGVAPLSAVESLSDEAFKQAQGVNVGAVFALTRAAIPVMRSQGGGCIVNVSSMASIDPFPGFAVYGAAKAWVNIFTRALADELAPHGIRVYAVAPGAVETDMLRKNFPTFPKEKTMAPDEVAAAIDALLHAEGLKHASGETVFLRKR